MAGDYDSGMKRLVKINPADYVNWLVQDAIYLEEYNPHLPNRSIDAEEIHRFHFGVIKLWEIATEELRQTDLTGLLALLPLTKKGARREVVETMIDDLQSETDGQAQRDMLSIGLTFATLVFNKKDQDWLTRRISMLEDILEESPFYQHILHRGEEKGLEKMRETVLEIVQARFPRFASLAKQQVAVVDDLGILSELIVNLSLAKDEVEVKKKLLEVDEDEEEDS